MSLPIRLCDLTSDELAGRNFLEDIFEKHSHPSTREPSKQENQARGDYADFVKALLGSREVSRRATIDDLVRLLGTREYDELD